MKLEFINPDATPHNLVIVKPGTGDAVGLAATRMAADPELAKNGQYIPKTDAVLFHTKMVPPLPAKRSDSGPQNPGATPTSAPSPATGPS